MPEPNRKTAMISSTSLDLPEHRQQAVAACLRQGIFPKAMEHLPARDADAISVSLKMVDEADIYIGIYAWRYGHVPAGHDISITEMEFNRAEERGIPILVFTMHDAHPLTRAMVEADQDAQEKLQQLKERACQGRGRLELSSSRWAPCSKRKKRRTRRSGHPACTRLTSFPWLPCRTSRTPTHCSRHAR